MNEAGKLSSLPTPTRSSYIFDGWFTAVKGGTAVTTETVFNQDTTIYAQWTYAGGSANHGGSSSAPDSGTPVIVDGKRMNIGKETKFGDNTTVTVDQSKLSHNLKGAAAAPDMCPPKSLKRMAGITLSSIPAQTAPTH